MPFFIRRKTIEASVATEVNAQVQKIRESLPYYGMVDPDDYLYRKLTTNKNRNLPDIAHERQIELAAYFFKTNPKARRIIETTKDFIIGKGIKYEANDPKVKEILDEFWIENSWEKRQHDFPVELGLYGEQCYPVAINEYNGKVELGYIDPGIIKKVVVNKENCLIVEKVKLKGSTDTPGKELEVIKVDKDPNSATYGRLIGDCFYFKTNSVISASRGHSDLLCLLDWLDGYDQFLFNRLERNALINAFVWNVTLEGMTQEEIAKWLQNVSPPKPGAIRAHNEKVKYEAVAPDLKAQDAATDAKLIANHIGMGAGFPDYWFSGRESGITTSEMDEPAFKKISSRQVFFKGMLEQIFKFVIDQAIISKRLEKGVDTDFKIILPDISQKDNNRHARALGHIGTLLQRLGDFMEKIIANEDIIGKKQSQELINGYTIITKKLTRVMAIMMGQMGVEINMQDELDRLKSQIDEPETKVPMRAIK